MDTRACPRCHELRPLSYFSVGAWQRWIVTWLVAERRARFTFDEICPAIGIREPRRSWNALGAAVKALGLVRRPEKHGAQRVVYWYVPARLPELGAVDERCSVCRGAGAAMPAQVMQTSNAPEPAPVCHDRPHGEYDPPCDICDGKQIPRISDVAISNDVCAGPLPPEPEPRVEVVRETITQVEEHRLKVELRDVKAQLKSTIAELSDARAMYDLARAAEAADKPDPIKPREKGATKKREACALVLASDWHIEEEVRPEAVAMRNRYNLDISKQRMARFFEATRWALDNNRHAFILRDLVLWLGGDLITNYLHDDNRESNLLSPVEAINYAFVNISEGIRHLLKDPELEQIVIPCNDGNHGRLTEKVRAATRIENSIECLLYMQLAAEFKSEPRVRFILPEGVHTYYEVYGRTIRFTHGDTVKYSGGVGGITIPINKAIARWQSVRHADLTCMGHFHQLTSLRDLIINGSLIGYNAYAMQIGAMFEEPAQSFSIIDPYRFKSIHVPLWVGSRDDDARAVSA